MERSAIDTIAMDSITIGRAECIEAEANVCIDLRALGSKEITFIEECSQIAGESAESEFSSAQEHVGKSWMHRQRCHASTMRCDGAVAVKRTEFCKKLASLHEGSLGWSIEPCEFMWIGDTPLGKVERKRSKVGFEYLGLGKWQQVLLFSLRPESIADAGFESTGPATALIG
jgi:hypothetical protein